MQVFRICKREHGKTGEQAMSGEGGLHGSARWHTRGHRIVYTATSTPLATLEIAVNLKQLKVIPDYVALEVDVPDDSIITLTASVLPAGWDALDCEPVVSRAIGNRWLEGEVSLALQIPSVVIPDQYNVLINPRHPDFDQVTFTDPMPFPFDPRIKQ
jgi:RES domain-containing protein